MDSLTKNTTLVTDLGDRTRKDIIYNDHPLKLGDEVEAFGREDAIVERIYPNCPTRFDQWIGVTAIDDRFI